MRHSLTHAFRRYRMKPEMWAKVAEDLQVPWRAAEAMHWALGEAEMARRAGVVPFSMAPAGYGETATATAASSSSSASGYTDPLPAQDFGIGMGGRARSGLRHSNVMGEEMEGGPGVKLNESYRGRGTLAGVQPYAEAEESVENFEGRRRRRRPVSEGSGSEGTVLPSLAEFEGGVPAFAGLVGEMGKGRGEGREEFKEVRSGSQEEEREDHGSGP